MKFDFPIEKIEFDFHKAGTGSISVQLNGNNCDRIINGDSLKSNNKIRIFFEKKNASDQKSYVLLNSFKVNGEEYKDHLKKIPYTISKKHHPDSVNTIENNLYFGFVGHMELELSHSTDKLSKAAWLLANENFEFVKWPLREKMYRKKEIKTVMRDAKFMFNGSMVADDVEIDNFINNVNIKDLRYPIDFKKDRKKIESWINQSSRISVSNFDSHPHFSFSHGVLDSVNSFIQDSKVLFIPEKTHFFNLEMLKDKQVNVRNPFSEEFIEGASLFFEYPSPWYDNKLIEECIKKANKKNCNIALDLTWLPMSNQKLDLDLTMIDQIFFSMTKIWPLTDFRPAWRWSNTKINDFQTIGSNFGYYTKAPALLFMKLIDKFSFDYVYEKYKKSADEVNKVFDMDATNILWFSTHKTVMHDKSNYINDYYHLDEFVCIKKLLDHKDKYWW